MTSPLLCVCVREKEGSCIWCTSLLNSQNFALKQEMTESGETALVGYISRVKLPLALAGSMLIGATTMKRYVVFRKETSGDKEGKHLSESLHLVNTDNDVSISFSCPLCHSNFVFLPVPSIFLPPCPCTCVLPYILVHSLSRPVCSVLQ